MLGPGTGQAARRQGGERRDGGETSRGPDPRGRAAVVVAQITLGPIAGRL